MKKNFIFKIVLACLTLCISLNARTQTTAYETYLSEGIFTQTTAPTGEVRFPAEFEPVQAVMVVYPLNLPWELLQKISNLEDCKLITVVNTRINNSTADGARQDYINNGVNINNCEFIEAGINSHWIRDFGPWYVFNGKEPVIVDNIYNRSFVDDDSYPIENPTYNNTRWYDDKFAAEYANNNSVHLYGMGVIHTGGNMMQDGRGVGVSDLIVHTQSETFAGISKETVNQRMNDYLGIDTYHVTIDPQGDYIAHVDCWGKLLAPDKIIIARVPSTHEQYSAYEEVASYFASTNCCWGYPYKVYRVDVPVTNKSEIKTYNKIAPYTNSLIVNKTVFVPISSLTSSEYNNAALQVYRDAMPGYEIVGINYVIEDAEIGDYSGWKNTDALHCRTRDIMDFNMLFVDHRNVLFGEQTYQESYPITAKFIAYSGNNITSTQLHYSINDGAYQTVEMTATGNADEYTANITGHNNGDVIKYYVTGEDASGKTCVQPQFGELEPHTFTAGEASGQPTKTVLNTTKYYRIKTASGTGYQYLTIFDHTSNPLGTYGGVGVAMLDEDNAGQMFKLEDAGEGKYYLISADGYYIYCQSYNVDAIDGTQKSTLWGFDSEINFELQCDKGYFKVENVSGKNYVFCNASKETRATIATWGLEEVPLSVTISANSTSVTVNESVQLNATAIGGTGNYTYSWSPATSFADATVANPTFTSATASDYTFTCTVTDNGESVTSNTVTITVNEAGTGGGTGSDVVTIDNTTTMKDITNSMFVPIYNNYEYSITQQYYTASEINKKDGGTITKIAFKTKDKSENNYPYTRNIEVYIVNTSESLFSSKTMKRLNSSDCVYSGSITFNAESWVSIPLSKHITYTGENLLICINDITGGSFVSPAAHFYTYASGESMRCLYQRNSESKYDPTTSNLNAYSNTGNVPFIQLTFGDAGTTPDQPVNPTISVDKTRIEADGTDYATFTVTPADAEIYWYKGTETATKLNGNKFNTSIHGTYSFYAKKDELVSETITVEAVANDLTITPSVNTILANGIEEVTFTVTQVDVNGKTQDVTNKCTFKINGTAITGNTFFTNRAGDYTVTATKNSKETSAQITATAVSGEENVVLIDGNVMQPAENTTIYTVPVNNYDNYGVSQQYYTKNEIGKDEGIITYIAFKTAKDAGTYIRDIEIYMANTDESDFGSGKVMKQMTNLVYSGKIQFSSNSWIKIPLTTEFTYTGNNILVCINDKTGSQIDPLTSHFDTYAKGYNDNIRTLYKSGATALDPTSEIVEANRIGFTPFVKFTFEKEQEVITLKANKTLIKADDVDYVSFGVQKEGLNPENVTEESEIHILREGDQTETVLDNTTGFEFTATVAGNYTAYAKKGEATSNIISFRAVYPIEITASTDTIVADNVDYVTFTVKQSTGPGSEPIDITNAATIYVDKIPLGVGVNIFKTDIIDTYFVYAEYDNISSNVVTVFAKSHINYDEDIEGSLDGEYFNPKGYVTYNKGEDNEYTLVARKEDGKAIIMEDNVWTFGTGTGTSIELKRPNPHKPQADATLIIPEKILFDDNWVTVTEIEDYAFDTLFEYRNYDNFNPGDPLNKHFTNLIIPSTIEKVGTYTFGFPVETSIICFAPVPPEVTGYPPFLKDTYKNAILYVPAPYVDAYKEAKGWGKPTDEADKDAYFVNILPIETPTFYIAGSWDNVNNWVPDYGYPDPGEDVIILADAIIEDNTVANVGRVDIISGSITIADGGQLIHTNPGVSVTLEKEIIGYHGNTSPTSWYTISSPLYPSIESSTVENLLANDYDLYRYDEPTHYWDNIEDLLDTIEEGPKGNWTKLDAARGYLYANNEDVTLKFKGVANHTGGTYTLTRDVWDGVLIGFHLVGNPFTHDIYMNNAFNTDATLADGYYVLSSTGAWSTKLGSDEAIKPCQGVLINASTEGTLTINKKVGPAVAQTQTRSRANNEFLTISVANKNYEDVTYVSFDAITPLEKVNHQNKDIPMVYIPMEEAIYAIAAMKDDVKEIPVAFEAKTMGQYTISVKAENCEFESMYLIDRKTGVETDLLLEDYTFLATTTDNSERFTIRLNDNSSDNEDFIFINNGEIIINKIEGKGVLQIFDVMGRYISHSEVSGSANISTEAFTSGVYIIRMTDDNGIKTQKVVL